MKEIEKEAAKQERFKIYTQDNKTYIKSGENKKEREQYEKELIEE